MNEVCKMKTREGFNAPDISCKWLLGVGYLKSGLTYFREIWNVCFLGVACENLPKKKNVKIYAAIKNMLKFMRNFNCFSGKCGFCFISFKCRYNRTDGSTSALLLCYEKI